jgi:retron-type reverse transcriptase
MATQYNFFSYSTHPRGASHYCSLSHRRYFSSDNPADDSNKNLILMTDASDSSSPVKTKSENSVKNAPDNICKYLDIITEDNLELGLARTKSGVSAGLDGEIKATYVGNPKKIKALSDKLKIQKYQPSPTRKVQIPKPDGGTRPLAIANQQDKIVQAAILCQLEPILEKVFLDTSFGFRPKLGCHNALHRIKRK